MSTPTKAKKKVRLKRTQFRFASAAHYRMVIDAKAKSGLSLNAWMVQATMKQARKELQP